MAVVKFLLKTLFGLFVLVVVLAVCLVGLAIWSVPKLGPKGIDSWIESKTGFSATVSSVDLKIFSGSLGIEGMALINPPYYQSKNCMQVRQISVRMQPRSLFSSRTVYDEVIVDVDRITWVKNVQGTVNIVEFFDKLTKKRGSSLVAGGKAELGTGKAGDKKGYLDGDYIIKKLIIKVGEIDMVGVPSENDSQNFALNYSKEFTDVTDIESIVRQVIVDFSIKGVLNLGGDVLGMFLDSEVLGSKVRDKIQNGAEKLFRYLQKETK